VKAVAAISDAALITVRGREMVQVTQALAHTFTSPSSPGAEVLLIGQSSSHKDVCLVVHASVAKALRSEFAQDAAHQQVEQIKVDSTVAVVTVVGLHVCTASRLIDRMFGALARENVDVLPIAQASSECTLSYLVARKDMKAALVTTHREFQLGELESQPLAVSSATDGPVSRLDAPEQASADAD
jgi:aspartokinase